MLMEGKNLFNLTIYSVNITLFVVGTSFSYFLLQFWWFRKEPLLKNTYLRKSKILGVIVVLIVALRLFIYNIMPDKDVFGQIDWFLLASCIAGLNLFGWRSRKSDHRINMRKAYQIIIMLGLCLFLFLLYFKTIPSEIYLTGIILAFLSLVLAIPITLIIGVTRWRKSSRFWMLPTLLCLIFISSIWQLNAFIGTFLSDQYFRRHLNEYIQVVDDVKTGVIPWGEHDNMIDIKKIKKPPPHIGAISAVRYNDGKTVLVTFITDYGCALYHQGYVYKGYEETDASIITEHIKPEQCWHHMRHIAGKWYYVSY